MTAALQAPVGWHATASSPLLLLGASPCRPRFSGFQRKWSRVHQVALYMHVLHGNQEIVMCDVCDMHSLRDLWIVGFNTVYGSSTCFKLKHAIPACPEYTSVYNRCNGCVTYLANTSHSSSAQVELCASCFQSLQLFVEGNICPALPAAKATSGINAELYNSGASNACNCCKLTSWTMRLT